MEKTVYIHIGPHKTGTTTIQSGLAINEKTLRRQHVLAPMSGRPYLNNAGNHNLSWELRIPNNPGVKPEYGTWKDLLREIKKNRQIQKFILTSEDFCLLDEVSIRTIREYLSDYQVKVIIYLRRQDEAHQSLWVEFAKNSWNLPIVGSFEEWLEEYDYAIRNYNYLEIISKWEAVFLQENMILRIFETSHFKPSLFHDFLSLCDIQHNGIITPEHSNISPGVKTIEAIRLLKNHIDFSHLVEKKWNPMAMRLIEFGAKQGWNDTKVNYLSEELSSKIMRRHETANSILAKKYFNRDVLFDKSKDVSHAATSFTYDDFTKDEVISIFSAVINLLTFHHG